MATLQEYLQGKKTFTPKVNIKLVPISPTAPAPPQRIQVPNWRGRDVYLSYDQAVRYNQAGGEEQFRLAKEYGLIPEDSRYVEDEAGGWGYTTVAEKTEAKKLKKETEIKEGKKAVKQAKDYIDDRQYYDIHRHLAEKPKEEHIIRYLAKTEQIEKAKKYNEVIQKVEKVSIPQKIWRFLTPWSEEVDETFISYMKNQFGIGREQLTEQESQSRLKAEYNAYMQQPLWMKALIDKPVIYDEDSDKYYRLIYGYGPPISPAKKGGDLIKIGTRIVRTLGPEDLGLTKEQYARFLKFRVNNPKITPQQWQLQRLGLKPKLDWDAIFKEIIERGPKRVSKTTFVTEKLTPAKIKQMEKIAEGIARGKRISINWPKAKQRWIEEMERVVAQQAKQTAKEAKYIPSIISDANKARIKEILEYWKRLNPRKRYDVILISPYLATVIVNNPKEMARLLSQMKPEHVNRILNELNTAVKQATKNITMTQSQTQNLIDIQTALHAQYLTQLAEQLQNQLAQQQKTETQIQNAVENEIQTQLKNITNPVVREKVSQIVQPKPKITTTIKTTKPPIRPPSRPPEKPPKPPKPPIRPRIPSLGSDNVKREYIKNSKGAICWRQGEVSAKGGGRQDVWKVLVSPFESKGDLMTVVGKRPVGARVIRGPRSAYKTVQHLYGINLSKEVIHDIGLFDAILTPISGGKGVAISFRHSPEISGTAVPGISGGKVFPLGR